MYIFYLVFTSDEVQYFYGSCANICKSFWARSEGEKLI